MKSRAAKRIAAIAPEINSIDDKVKALGHYFLFYTHTYEQKSEKAKNLLVFPKDPRFDDAEFYGLIIDLIRDYELGRGIKLADDRYFKCFAEMIAKIANGELEDADERD